ncbi:MAG: MBL fold metallo-hydrolase [Pyrodictiaceae archaeon]
MIDNIYMVRDQYVNVYIMFKGNNIILIDAGLETTWRLLAEALAGYGGLSRVSAIVVTHHHRDHVGSLKRIVEESGAIVGAHVEEARLVEETTGVKVGMLLRDGDRVHGMLVLHTPGHTPGHIALIDEATKSLFTGDLVYEENGVLYEIPQEFSQDPRANRMAITRLLDYDFENILPAHGNPIMGFAKQRLEELVNRLGVR